MTVNLKGLELIENRFKNIDVNLLYIFCERSLNVDSLKEIKLSEKITKVSFDYHDYKNNETMEVNMPVLKKFFKKEYKISTRHLTFKDYVKMTAKSLQWVFSVRNTGNHKCFTVLGIKIKFRKQKNK